MRGWLVNEWIQILFIMDPTGSCWPPLARFHDSRGGRGILEKSLSASLEGVPVLVDELLLHPSRHRVIIGDQIVDRRTWKAWDPRGKPLERSIRPSAGRVCAHTPNMIVTGGPRFTNPQPTRYDSATVR